MKRIIQSAVFGCLCLSIDLLPLFAVAAEIRYDPTLGTLPDDQGFIRQDSGAPTPTVTGGLLHQDTTPNILLTQWWITGPVLNGVPINFAAGFTIDLRIRILESGYVPSAANGTQRRTGYEFAARDDAGYFFGAQLASTGLFVSTHGNGLIGYGSDFIPFDTTDGFHDYRLVTQGSSGHLFIDGQWMVTVPLIAPEPGEMAGTGFGENTGRAANKSELASFRYTPEALVPEPAGLAIILLGAVMGWPLLRKRSVRFGR